jgi:prevent-host-death family protein
MPLPADFHAMDTAPASDIKAKGWPGLIRRVRASGAVLVTNHNHPEAVVVDAEAYRQLVAAANAAATPQAEALRALQAEFDARLGSPSAAEGLARALARPARRGGAVTLGKPR